MNYSDLLRANKELGKTLKGEKYQVVILSNIITYHLNDILEYVLRVHGINVYVNSGNYNNILQDSEKSKNSNLVIIFWNITNIVDGMQYKANVMDDKEINSLLSKVKSEIDFVLMNLKDTSIVLFNKFSSLLFNHSDIKNNKLDKICNKLNEYVKQKALSNVIIVDIDKVIAKTSVDKCVDFRFFYSSKSLYTIEFYKNYAEFIKPIVLAANGKAKKALIFDCDNTLWKGIVGEDGFDGIEMLSTTKDGAIFKEVQYLALELNKRGIVLGLCTKNNPQDIEGVLTRHPDMVIRDEHITIKKVNWNDKVLNLKEIAKELNIGLDSLVFVEDSDFEVNYVKEQLPQVTILQVPGVLYEYPKMLRECAGLFYTLSKTSEDRVRSQMYKQQKERESEKAKFSNLEDYLKTLNLQLTIYINNRNLAPRMSQMTQKTNQFNLTTKRYTESDIEKFIKSDKYKLFAFDARDRFGSHGVAGLCIFQFDNNAKKSGVIDSFLMSCRVIGRNIEFSFFDFIVNNLKETGIAELEAKYTKTLKNIQVTDFYEQLGFEIVTKSDSERIYNLKLSQYKPKNLTYIGVEYG